MGLSWGLLHLCHCCLEPDNPLSWAALCGEREDVCPPLALPTGCHEHPSLKMSLRFSALSGPSRTSAPPPRPPSTSSGSRWGQWRAPPRGLGNMCSSCRKDHTS